MARPSPSTAVVFDCEFLTAEGAPRRFWCGPRDPDPVIAQIGAVRLGLDGGFPVLGTLKVHVRPVDRNGRDCDLDPLFVRLTGITPERIREEGRPLGEALTELDRFSAGADLWSWGKDEFNMVAISCYVAGIAPVIPATRFGNAARLLVAAGLPEEEIHGLRSNTLAAHFGLDLGLTAHDGLDDALSVAHALRHLLIEGRLSADRFGRPSEP